MKLVILDGYAENPGDLSWDILRQFGLLTVYDRTSLTDPDEAIARIGDAQLLLTNKTPVTRAVLDGCPNVQFIGVLATGYNVVDCQAARERGIPVCNVPAYGTATVAQHTIALLLEICHHVGSHDQSVHQGHWAACPDFCYWDYPILELSGKTMGIIGFGRIGRQTGRIARALGMRVLATGSRPTPEGQEIAQYTTLDTLLAQSDVISLHAPVFPETQNLIRQETIAKMKDGVILLNSSRGQLICEADLAQALRSSKVAYAGLDVVCREPILPDNPLLQAPHCLITPHIAWAARESRQRILDCTAENIRAFLAGTPVHVVNL